MTAIHTQLYNFDKKLNKCPLCGEKKRIILTKKIFPKEWKRWSVECLYCHCRKGPYLTKMGAKRRWNRATSIVSVREVREGENG